MKLNNTEKYVYNAILCITEKYKRNTYTILSNREIRIQYNVILSINTKKYTYNTIFLVICIVFLNSTPTLTPRSGFFFLFPPHLFSHLRPSLSCFSLSSICLLRGVNWISRDPCKMSRSCFACYRRGW